MLDVPVFRAAQPAHLLVCAATAVLVFFTAHLIESRYRMLLWCDAVALSAYGNFGAYKGLLVTGSATVAIAMAIFTGTLGGILRDVLAREPSVLLRKAIYVAAVLAGTTAFIALQGTGMPLWPAAAAGFLIALLVRGGTLHFGWTLPADKSRPGCDTKDILWVPRDRTPG